MTEDYVLEKIKELMPEKNKIPHGILYAKLKVSVQEDLSKALSNLFNIGKIKYSKTLNDILISPNE